MSEDLRAFHADVLVLVAELTQAGPCLSLEVELARRKEALSAFWRAWLPFSRVGYPTKDRLDELEFALREPLWLAKFATVEKAVRHLCHAVRSRSKPIEDLELLPELVAAPVADQADITKDPRVAALPEPERSYIVARDQGDAWSEAAARMGHDDNTMRRCRESLRKEFMETRSYAPSQPKRVRARLKRR
jgi:hypothetical protein